MKKLITTCFVYCMLVSSVAFGKEDQKIMVMNIKGEIDPRTLRYVKLAFEHVEDINANIVIIHMDTYGGVLTHAKDIVDMILDLNIPIWVFINKDAASAGALISIACDSIYMAPWGTIGAATVVNQNGKEAPDKYQSYMRSIMRATAEERGRNPNIAEGMVDEEIIIEGLVGGNEVITFTVSEAIQNGYCEAKLESIDAILKRNHIENYEIVTFNLSVTEQIISFFINPFISGILILLILGGLYFELQSPGVGFPLGTSIIALILYLTPYYLNGLAENWEIIMLFISMVLILVEMLIIPGFGFAGVFGIILALLSLTLIMLDNDFLTFDLVPIADITSVLLSVFGGITGGIFLIVFSGNKIMKTNPFKRLSLQLTQAPSKGYVINIYGNHLVGQTGVAYTTLRPGGKIMINNKLYVAVSSRGYIEKGTPVQVLKSEGRSLKVITK